VKDPDGFEEFEGIDARPPTAGAELRRLAEAFELPPASICNFLQCQETATHSCDGCGARFCASHIALSQQPYLPRFCLDCISDGFEPISL